MTSHSSDFKQLIVGLDASNIRSGGGLTHLMELIGATEPGNYGISKIMIWGGRATLSQLPDYPWLEKINPSSLNRGLVFRMWWQKYTLARSARSVQCNILFILGGSYSGSFKPIVTMNQNLLPFEWNELRRYRWSVTTLRLLLLRLTQSYTLKSADGVIFLSRYAHDEVQRVIGSLHGKVDIIPHGISRAFIQPPRPQYNINTYSLNNPCRLLYVSAIDQYKHQWQVVEAVARLRERTGWPLVLDLVGPAYVPALRRLKDSLETHDPLGQWVHYYGAIPYNQIHKCYARADIGLWASSCETFGMILLEKMAAGLPVACSNKGPMPDILGNAGIYFDPENPDSIASALRELIGSPEKRESMARCSFQQAQSYSWQQCADQTFTFLVDSVGEYEEFKHME